MLGPLDGIPVLLKDNIDATPMVNSGGSLALADHHPATDAFLVKRLRAAGAVILGKTNLSEWANFRSTRSTSGWSWTALDEHRWILRASPLVVMIACPGLMPPPPARPLQNYLRTSLHCQG